MTRRKHKATVAICWTVFLALMLSFVFFGANVSVGRYLSRARSGPSVGRAAVSGAVGSVQLACLGDAELAEKGEDETLRKELFASFTQRGLFFCDARVPVCVRPVCAVAVDRVPANLPLRI
jgi:hypothetical protein